MVLDDQIWKLTFHAQGMASETGPDENCRCALGTAPARARKGEKFKKVLAKALTMVLDGGSQVPQSARTICPLLGTHQLWRLLMQATLPLRSSRLRFLQAMIDDNKTIAKIRRPEQAGLQPGRCNKNLRWRKRLDFLVGK